MDNFNLQAFVKKSKDEFYTNLYEGKEKHSMEEKMHDDDHKMEEKMHDSDHKMEENHQSLAPEVAERIEGLLNINLKGKFLAAGHAVITDFLEDEMMDVEDIVSHLANELEKHYYGRPVGEDTLEEGEIADEMEDEFYDGEHEEKKDLTNEVSMNASDLETAMALLSGILGLPAVAVLSQKAQDKLKAVKAKGKEALAEDASTVKEVSMNASDLETAMALLSGILGLPAVAVLSQKAQDKLKAVKAKGKEAVGLAEEEGDEIEIEDEIEVPAEVDMDIDMEAPESEAEDSKEIFSKLVDAYESAKALGDEKLTRQLANTITYFNKSVIFGDTK